MDLNDKEKKVLRGLARALNHAVASEQVAQVFSDAAANGLKFLGLNATLRMRRAKPNEIVTSGELWMHLTIEVNDGDEIPTASEGPGSKAT